MLGQGPRLRLSWLLVGASLGLAFASEACSHDWGLLEATGGGPGASASSSGGSSSRGGASATGGGSPSTGGATASGGASSVGSGGASTASASSTSTSGGGPLCGNGTVDPGEECDDGNAVSGDGCTNCIVDCTEPGAFKDPMTHHCYWSIAAGQVWAAAGALCRVDAKSDLAALSTVGELNAVGAQLPSNAWLGGMWNGTAWVWSFNEPWIYGDDQATATAPWAVMHGENHMFRQCVFLASPTTIDAGHCTTDVLPSICERTP
jgi:cysteine-rich repeat protein